MCISHSTAHFISDERISGARRPDLPGGHRMRPRRSTVCVWFQSSLVYRSEEDGGGNKREQATAHLRLIKWPCYKGDLIQTDSYSKSIKKGKKKPDSVSNSLSYT